MELKNDSVILRDFIQSDIQKRVYWETVENEWQLWDAPWEYEGKSKDELIQDLEEYKTKMLLRVSEQKGENDLRTGFQICINDGKKTYIGWCGSYNINDNFEITDTEGQRAVGICIPAMVARGKGFATSAMVLFINYLMKNKVNEIYTQTWSGNKRMIGLANKLGFEECMRKSNIHKVHGKLYDDLTFRLNIEKFHKFSGIAK